MDLKSYGIRKSLVSQASLSLGEEDVAKGTYEQGVFDNAFHLPSGTYRIERKLGEGSYGKIYEVMSEMTGDIYAVKAQKYESQEEFQEMVHEAIVNILLEESSRKSGPYVQQFYEVAHDPLLHLVFMRMEVLDGTLGDLLYSNSVVKNDQVLPRLLIQLATILEFFQTHLGMNHRDLKSNNIMYTMVNGAPVMKLIDLGLTCMTYKGIHFGNSALFPKTHTCNRKGRDLSFLLLELLLDFPDRMSPALYDTLRGLAKLTVKGKDCQLDRYCPQEGLVEWKNSYTFLNRPNVENPQTTPAEVKKRMSAFLEKLKAPAVKKRRFTVRKRKNALE
jgi:serine/threonine protein kinase